MPNEKQIQRGPSPWDAIENLDLSNKQSIVDLVMFVDGGYISKRRAADEIMKAHQAELAKWQDLANNAISDALDWKSQARSHHAHKVSIREELLSALNEAIREIKRNHFDQESNGWDGFTDAHRMKDLEHIANKFNAGKA